MKWMRLVAIFATVAVLLVATPTVAGADSQSRPLFITLEGHRGDTPTSVVGVGSATHLGQVQLDIERQFGRLDQNLCQPLLFLQMTLTAANGDELYLESVSGELCILIIEEDFFFSEVNAELDVDGGSGRFANATGHVTMQLSSVFPRTPGGIGSFTATLDGHLGY